MTIEPPWWLVGRQAIVAAAGLSLIGGEAAGFWGAVVGAVVGGIVGARFAVGSGKRNGHG